MAARRTDAYTRLTAACHAAAALPIPDMVTREWGVRYKTVRDGKPCHAVNRVDDHDHAAMISDSYGGQIVTRPIIITGPWRPETE